MSRAKMEVSHNYLILKVLFDYKAGQLYGEISLIAKFSGQFTKFGIYYRHENAS